MFILGTPPWRADVNKQVETFSRSWDQGHYNVCLHACNPRPIYHGCVCVWSNCVKRCQSEQPLGWHRDIIKKSHLCLPSLKTLHAWSWTIPSVPRLMVSPCYLSNGPCHDMARDGNCSTTPYQLWLPKGQRTEVYLPTLWKHNKSGWDVSLPVHFQ